MYPRFQRERHLLQVAYPVTSENTTPEPLRVTTQPYPLR